MRKIKKKNHNNQANPHDVPRFCLFNATYIHLLHLIIQVQTDFCFKYFSARSKGKTFRSKLLGFKLIVVLTQCQIANICVKDNPLDLGHRAYINFGVENIFPILLHNSEMTEFIAKNST